MQVTDEGELWALYCAIRECKFGEPSCSLELAGSATLGQVIDRLLVDLRQCRVWQTTEPPGGLPSWEAMLALRPDDPGWKRFVEWDKARKLAARSDPEWWRKLNPERPEWQRVVQWVQASKSREWDSWSINEKREYIRLLALPYAIPAEHESVLLSI
jgi:hypothetical protein